MSPMIANQLADVFFENIFPKIKSNSCSDQDKIKVQAMIAMTGKLIDILPSKYN